ncbi:MAG TPA: inositol monophosphatase family protein, partial [Amaricoccus sp.]|nr:inositol monophosphatase family protein [Amaricoccus sp.]
LAHGFVDLVIESSLQPYDIVPLIPVVEAAGGVVTGLDGAPPLGGGTVIAAANPGLHAQALALLRSA